MFLILLHWTLQVWCYITHTHTHIYQLLSFSWEICRAGLGCWRVEFPIPGTQLSGGNSEFLTHLAEADFSNPSGSTRLCVLYLMQEGQVEAIGLCPLCSWGSGMWGKGGCQSFPGSSLGFLHCTVSSAGPTVPVCIGRAAVPYSFCSSLLGSLIRKPGHQALESASSWAVIPSFPACSWV